MSNTLDIMAGIYVGLLILNLFAMVVLWRSTGSLHYRTLAVAWCGTIVGVSLVPLVPPTAEQAPILRMLAFAPAFLNYASLARLLAQISGLSFRAKRFFEALVGALLVGALLDTMGASTTLSLTVVAIATSLPATYVAVRVIHTRWSTLSPVLKAFAVILLVHGVHGSDYGVWPATPRATFAGFSIALALAAAISVFAPASALEHITGERGKLQAERKRASAVKRILDNVDEGFFSLDPQGRMSDERSSVLSRWFGPGASNQRFSDYVAQWNPAFSEAFEGEWEQLVDGFLPAEVVLQQLPSRLIVADRTLAFRYRPVFEEERLAEVIVVVSDITAEIERERAEAEARDLVSAATVAIRDPEGFRQFLREGDTQVERIIGSDGSTTVMRDLHTLKGNAGVYELCSLSRLCHNLEDLVRERQAGLTETERRELSSRWKSVSSLVGGSDGLPQVDAAEEQEVISMIRGGVPSERVIERIRRWRWEPAARGLHRLAAQARNVAQRLEKGEIEVICRANGVRLDSRRWGGLWQALVHTVRNAVDHGLESPMERTQAGKPAEGKLELATAYEEGEVVFRITDDGRGIDWDALRERARQHGFSYHTDDDLVELLFSDGVSSRVASTELSGRGVGLSALRQEVRALSGSVRVHSTMGRGTCFELRFPSPSPDVAPPPVSQISRASGVPLESESTQLERRESTAGS